MRRTCVGCGASEWSRAYSRSYSDALRALRDNYPDEFEDLRSSLLAARDDEEWAEWHQQHDEHGTTTVNR